MAHRSQRFHRWSSKKKALLSISDGRAASFFNTFIKIITPPPFYGQRIFGCKDTKKKRDMERKTEKFREKRRILEKIREKQRIICKFSGISVRIICKSLLISVRCVRFFLQQGTHPARLFYLFTLLPFYL